MIVRPLRLEVQFRIAAALEEISPAGGYTFDLRPTVEVPRHVFRGRTEFGEDDPLPMIAILEPPIAPDQRQGPYGSGMQTGNYELVIQGFLPEDEDDPTDPGHFLLADVKKRLAVEAKRDCGDNVLGLGGIVRSMYIGGGVVRPPDVVSSKAYFWLGLTVDLVDDMVDPYLTGA